jgi:hypothetical protein
MRIQRLPILVDAIDGLGVGTGGMLSRAQCNT